METKRNKFNKRTIKNNKTSDKIGNAAFSIRNSYDNTNYWHQNTSFDGVKVHTSFYKQPWTALNDHIVQIRFKLHGISYTYRDKVTLEKESDILDPTIISPIIENILKDLENNDFSNFEVV